MSERQAYLWYVPTVGVAAHAARVVATGATHLRVKAGGDDGKVWAQWLNPRITQPYRDAGLRVTPWLYIWPTENDKAAIVRAQQAQPFDEVALNPETEWRVQSSENPWNSLAEANTAAAAWVMDLRARLAPGTRVAFSAVPSWDDFPYEGFARACDSAEPQHYWFANQLARNENQVQAHVRRAGAAMRCVPILTACQEHGDAEVVQLGRDALTALPTLAGFSSWECGNAGYQWQAMTEAYTLLPDDTIHIETKPSQPEAPTGEEIYPFINPQGQTCLVINFGGVAASVDGFSVVDVGVSVTNAAGEKYHRSVKGNAFEPWQKGA